MPDPVTHDRRRMRVAAAASTVAVAALIGAIATPGLANAAPVAPLAYDFGTATSVVAAGHTRVSSTTLYTADLGYGFTSLATLIDRDRGAASGDVQRDFVTGTSPIEFKADIPNGEYQITAWTGDMIASSSTNISFEGVALGNQSSASGVVAERVAPSVVVSDGQLNVVYTGNSPRINGLRIEPTIAAPTALAVTSVNALATPPSVDLAWQPVDGASGYRLFRSTTATGASGPVAEVTAPAATDATVTLGLEYFYTVVALNASGQPSGPSNQVNAKIVDADTPVPAVPTGFTLGVVNRNDVTFSWTADDTATGYTVERGLTADGPFQTVGTTTAPTFTDTMVLTTRAYFYRVIAVNAGGASAASASFATPVATTLVRQAEYLDRAPVAVKTDDGVYLGWRMLGLDSDDISFAVYRDGARISSTPITGSTNLVDPDGTEQSQYFVTAQIGDREVTVTDAFGVWAEQHLDIPLDKPADGVHANGLAYTYSPGDASVGDLDGDGEYEIVMLWSPSDSKDNSQAGYTGEVFVDAYRLDGTKLWRIQLGKNIRAGAHYTQVQVFDYDGDGKAEVAFKTADGTVDGAGTVIGNAAADYRNSGGYILSGPEFLTVFDGATGAAIDTVDYEPGRGNVASWGDSYGNRVDRFLAGTAYLDGEHPSLVVSRGYYTRTVIVTYDLVAGELVKRWSFDSNTAGAQYTGQGNHNLSVADVDGDGLDEITFGAMALDDDGSVLYNTNLHHGDASHLTDHIPSRPGLEVYSVFEDLGANGGIAAAMRDAKTGEVIWSTKGTRDTGRGAAGDIDPTHAGNEAWSIGGDYAWNSRVGTLKTAEGEQLSTSIPAANFLTWWDGDLLREITDHAWDATALTGVPTISKWDWTTNESVEVFRATGTRSNNGTKGNPVLQADLFGDWREEIVTRGDDGTFLRVFTTVDETEHRIRTLMHDPVYRAGVAWQNTAYNQPPHTGFFLGDGMATPAAPSIAYVAHQTVTDDTAPVLAGLPSGTVATPVQLGVTATDAESGVRTLEVTLDGAAVAPDALVAAEPGERELVVRAVNNAGLETVERVTLLVLPADSAKTAPGRGTLTSTSGRENGLHDGNYGITMNLWWGENGTAFRLYENGILVSTKLLADQSPLAQTAGFAVTGKPNGRYVYTGELINSKGVTATTSVTVVVNAANPGVAVLSHNNWDGDGAFAVTGNLWWDTNGTSYTLFENGVAVSSGPLVGSSPSAQKIAVPLTGRAVGSYEYRLELANAAGATSSAPLTVVVKK
ncbi:hypothetical protein GCM10027413_12780 [Conyzicola nivalis]|uniref:Fibronectin type-III domain-containing protein n=1 Tax=Conyzicola nivalis TaxID=1477021 RepID=A0A916SIC9_9MICO|nr:hypothetical protein [Conyzicola nivalis]GGB00585.1 hypothetical protein GCM10010979_13850 [Conyzicola nivalis]